VRLLYYSYKIRIQFVLHMFYIYIIWISNIPYTTLKKIMDLLMLLFIARTHKYSRTSQVTHYASATEPNRLMLFGETVAVYCENHAEHTDTVCRAE
jgi:hypothetical protein